MEWPVTREQLRRMDPGAPRYEQIAAAFAGAISAGRLRAGERLPTVRRLAADLGVGSATVSAAYNLLNLQGWTRGEVGRGTFVVGPAGGDAPAGRALPGERPAGAPRGRLSARSATPWRRRVLYTSAARLRSAHPGALDCTSGKPDTALLPFDVVRRAWHAAVEATQPPDLQYAGPEPVESLPRALVPRLAADNILARDADLVVGSSAQQLMGLALAVVAALHRRAPLVVAVEEPGYQTIYDTIERAGHRLVGVEVDEQGAIPASLDTALAAGAHAVLFTPRAHNPTGASWTVGRLAALADVLAAHPDAIAIEDDQLADLAAARAGSLLNDRRVDDRVVYIRSFAKTIAPDLRLAVAAARPRLRAALAEAKIFADGWSSRLAQRALAGVLADGALPDALATARRAYAARRVAALEILTARLLPAGGAASGADGINLWVHLPPGIDALEVIERAAALGALVAPGEPFFIRPGRGDVVRLSVGQVDVAQAAAAAATLAEAALTTASAPSLAMSV
ncbi:MAG TPA: PLP-dependent aminotransferase family protein [Thermomicrobiales bacterium]|nr:PLP-dependent aminotransferase family protein [Thermomicrobiales bacterium]